MAKSHIVLSNGAKIAIEGTPEEVAFLTARLSGASNLIGTEANAVPSHKPSVPLSKKKRLGPVGYIAELVQESFFKSKRSLPAVQEKLEEKGHIYAQESLSPALLHHVRKTKLLRRMKEKDGWVYVS
jgi:hypothetical protein